VPDKELSVDDAPIYASVNCVITQIPEDQNLYYQANPANNKKVRAARSHAMNLYNVQAA
jgi:hypothetical protein